MRCMTRAMRDLLVAVAVVGVFAASPTLAQDIKIALLAGKTGILEAYAKQTEAGFMLGLEYATKGTMKVLGRNIRVIVKDDQSKPDISKSLLEQAYGDDKVVLAVGTSSSAGSLAMLPVAEEFKRVLVVEPAVADSITGDKGNRYVFRVGRNSSQDALAAAAIFGKEPVSIATLAQDYAYGREAIAAFKQALVSVKSPAKVVFEEYTPQHATDFTASAQRLFDALKDRPGRKIIYIMWAGPHPLTKIADLDPFRLGIEIAPGGNILPVMMSYMKYPGMEGAIGYYYDFPKNPANDWLVAEYRKRFNAPPDLSVAGGMAVAIAVVTAIEKAGSTDTDKLIAAMEGMEFDTPKGTLFFRKEDHQAVQHMYHWRVKKDPVGDFDLFDLVRVIPASELPLPIHSKH